MPRLFCVQRGRPRSVAERTVYDQAVKGYHNTQVMELSSVCKGSLQPYLGIPVLGTTSCSVGCERDAQHSAEIKGTERKCKEGD